jgi:predicted sulfurtransferase
MTETTDRSSSSSSSHIERCDHPAAHEEERKVVQSLSSLTSDERILHSPNGPSNTAITTTTTTTATATSSTTMTTTTTHGDWSIALYYYYVDFVASNNTDTNFMRNSNGTKGTGGTSTSTSTSRRCRNTVVADHIAFHQSQCEFLGLKGRVRISPEGINGVLTGLVASLQDYERAFRAELHRLAEASMILDCHPEPKKKDSTTKKERNVMDSTMSTTTTTTTSTFTDDDACNGNDDDDDDDEDDDDDDEQDKDYDYDYLDIKYCPLRRDLSIESQLFDTLTVKETNQVVSLFETDELESKGSTTRAGRGRRSKQSNRRQRRRKEQQQQHKELVECTPEQQAERKELKEIQKRLSSSLQMGSSNKAAPHLSAREWNAKLAQLAAEAAAANKTSTTTGSSKAMLVDVRNVYESRIGHFAVPNVPTLLTNTRKYSDLPRLLVQSNYKEQFQDKEQVFLYCTGGVRCERVSVLLQSMYPETTFYQLKGGIQNYLKEATTATMTTTRGMEEDEEQMESSSLLERIPASSTDKDDDTLMTTTATTIPRTPTSLPSSDDTASPTQQASSSSSVSDDKKECYYFRGKNFVFDPRRTDPMQVPLSAAATKKTVEVVGTCLTCHAPHDDYDNGHAPRDNCEARCINCRMLILVCNQCRPFYTCWGDSVVDDNETDENNDDEVTGSVGSGQGTKSEQKKQQHRPLLYCGKDHCIHEGLAPEPEFVRI